MSSHKASKSSNFVNGQSCSYARLKTYANCSRAEPGVGGNKVSVAAPAPKPVVAPAVPAVPVVAPAVPAVPVVAPVAPAAAPKPEGYYGDMEYAMEGYLDPSPTSLPGGANTGATNYTPSYAVPNYPPIDATAFNSSEKSCGGYKRILGAYSGMNGSSCTTNYINN
jgi:hypothetical protein